LRSVRRSILRSRRIQSTIWPAARVSIGGGVGVDRCARIEHRAGLGDLVVDERGVDPEDPEREIRDDCHPDHSDACNDFLVPRQPRRGRERYV
jgi:hypothetical protein